MPWPQRDRRQRHHGMIRDQTQSEFPRDRSQNQRRFHQRKGIPNALARPATERKICEPRQSQWVVHRDARWYDAPEEFRPGRWNDDLLKRLPRFAYFPFGGGARQGFWDTFALV